jgi:Flp pilus assembly protein TadG
MTRLPRDRDTISARGFDEGAIALVAAVIIPLMLVLCGIAIDVGRWYVEVQKVQNAADAAALAGVTWMPNYLTNATTKAKAASATNGYPDAGTAGNTHVTVMKTEKDSELLVTVSSTISNIFGALFGNPTTTIVRGALADYQGSALMGSPCNTFGNEPNGTTYSGADQPQDSVIPPTEPGYATCQSRTPNFWAGIEGPATAKLQGDRFSTTVCSTSTTECADPDNPNPTPAPPYANKEYNAEGYYFVVRVGSGAVGHDVKIQIYDPAYVRTSGSGSDSLLSSDCMGLTGTYIDGMNPYAPDASSRYNHDTSFHFCTGDSDPGFSSTSPRMITTFAMRGRSSDYNPAHAPVFNQCVKQYRGVVGAPTASSGVLDEHNGAYRSGLAEVFHQWVDLCTFQPDFPGDYYLQVRTNAALVEDHPEPTDHGDPVTYSLSSAELAATPADVGGRGSNAFAIRAVVDPLDAQPTDLNAEVSVAGFERMPMYQNASGGTAIFNLLQVNPTAAGKDMYFSFFDAGDASGTGTVTVLRPQENITAGQTALPGCSSVKSGATTNISGNVCKTTISSASNDGHLQTVTVPIPTDYTCNVTSVGGCWFQVEVKFNAGSVHDFTTWTGSIGGDTVRLVK